MDSVYAVKSSTDVYRIAFLGWPLFPLSYAYSVFYLEISATGILDEANSKQYMFVCVDSCSEFNYLQDWSKIQFANTLDSEPYFFIKTADRVRAARFASDKYRFTETYFAPLINPSDVININGITMLQEGMGHIFVGQATQYKDFYEIQTVAQAKSGFFQGFDYINTCMESKGSIENGFADYKNLYNSASKVVSISDDYLINDSTSFTSSGSVSSLTFSSDFSAKTFVSGDQYTQLVGKCSVPTVYPPSDIPDQYYFINEVVSTSMDVTYGTWSIGPASLSTGYTLSMTQFEDVSNSDPTWATLYSGSNLSRIQTQITSLKGTWEMTLRGTITKSGQTSYSSDLPFTLYMIVIATTTVNDMELSLGKGDQTQTMAQWSFDPSIGDISLYTFLYEVEYQNGSAAPSSWINMNANEINLIDDQGQSTGTYTFRIIGKALDENGAEVSGGYNVVNFTVKVYTLVASTVVNQYYSIGQGSYSYQWPAFTFTEYTLTYSLLLASDGLTDAATTYSWLSLSTDTITLSTSTASDVGEFNLIIKGELNDSTNYPGDLTTDQVSITIWLVQLTTVPQNELFYIIGDTQSLTEAIQPFSYAPVSAGSFTITYAVTIPAGTPTIGSLAVDGNTDIVVGPETDTSLFGSHTVRMTGTMDDSSARSDSLPTTDYVEFTLNMIKLESSLADQTYRIEPAGTSKAITFDAVVQSPTGGNIQTYTYTYTLIGWDGSTESAADTAIFNKGSGLTVEIATADTSAASTHVMAIKATVDGQTTAALYIVLTAKLFTYTTQTNDYQVYSIGSSTHAYTIQAPILVSGFAFTETCALYQSDGTTLAATGYPWLSFDTVTKIITVSTSTPGLSGAYNMRYICTLDDDDSSVEETTITYYLIEATAVAQTDITYIISQAELTQAITAFTYDPLAMPLAGPVTWTYSVTSSSGNANICTVDSATGLNILVGTTVSAAAGATTGVISDLNLAGTHVYVLSGTVSGTDSLGRVFSAAAVTTTVNIELISITIGGSMADMFYRSAEAAEEQIFQPFTQSKTGGSIPNYLFDYTLVEWDPVNGLEVGAASASQVSVDLSTRTVSVFEADETFLGAVYELAIKATVQQVPSAYGYAPFQVNIYTFQAAPQTNPEYLIGTNPLVHNLAPYSLSVSVGNVASVQTVTYSLTLSDGTTPAAGAFSWLTVDLVTPSVTINTNVDADTGIYDFVLFGTYGSSSFSVSETFTIYVVKVLPPVELPYLLYKVGQKPSQLFNSPFELVNYGVNHNWRNFDLQVYLSDGSLSSTLPSAITYSRGKFAVTAEAIDDLDVGYYRMRISATALDDTGADINTYTQTVEFSVVIYQVYPQPLEDQMRVITYNSNFYDFPKFEVKPEPSLLVPAIEIDYGLRMVEHDNDIANPKIWDFTTIFANNEIYIQTDNLDYSANYTTQLTGTYYVWGREIIDYVEFNIELIKPAKLYVPVPKHDYFTLKDHSMDISESYSFNLGEQLSKTFDVFKVELTLNGVEGFATWNQTTNTFEIKEGALDALDVGRYRISAIAKFENSTYTEHYTDDFYLTIRDDNPFVPKPFVNDDLVDILDIVNEEVPFEYSDRDYPKITQVVEDLELATSFLPDQPIPYVRDLTTTGLLCIEWDRPMQIPERPEDINLSRVAVFTSNTTDENLLTRRRQLYHRYFEFFDNFEDDPEWYLLIEALELKVRPGDPDSDPDHLNFTWSLVSFDDRQIYIQLHFDYAQKLSERDIYDTLEIYFWGSELFRSAATGLPVRFGSKIERTILRQFDLETATWLWRIGLGLVWAIWAICLLTIILTGRVLATWMFLNSLQLVAHLVLFKSQMPAMAAYSFGQLLFVARFQPFPDLQFMNHQFGYLSEGGHDVRFVGFGYESIYMIANLDFILFIAALVIVMWLILLIKDFIGAKFGRICKLKERIWFDPFEGKWQNLAQRFTYEIFFELLICSMISLAVRRPYSDDNFTEITDKETWYEGIGGSYENYDTLLAAAALFIACCLFIWAVSFAWTQIIDSCLCGCRKAQGKQLSSLFCCSKAGCIQGLKNAPGIICAWLSCSNKKRRRKHKRALKYALKDKSQDQSSRTLMLNGDGNPNPSQGGEPEDHSKTAINVNLDDLDISDESDYILERAEQKQNEKKQFIKEQKRAQDIAKGLDPDDIKDSSENDDKDEKSGSSSEDQAIKDMFLNSAWRKDGSEFVPKSTFVPMKTRTIKTTTTENIVIPVVKDKKPIDEETQQLKTIRDQQQSSVHIDQMVQPVQVQQPKRKVSQSQILEPTQPVVQQQQHRQSYTQIQEPTQQQAHQKQQHTYTQQQVQRISYGGAPSRTQSTHNSIESFKNDQVHKSFDGQQRTTKIIQQQPNVVTTTMSVSQQPSVMRSFNRDQKSGSGYRQQSTQNPVIKVGHPNVVQNQEVIIEYADQPDQVHIQKQTYDVERDIQPIHEQASSSPRVSNQQRRTTLAVQKKGLETIPIPRRYSQQVDLIVEQVDGNSSKNSSVIATPRGPHVSAPFEKIVEQSIELSQTSSNRTYNINDGNYNSKQSDSESVKSHHIADLKKKLNVENQAPRENIRFIDSSEQMNTIKEDVEDQMQSPAQPQVRYNSGHINVGPLEQPQLNVMNNTQAVFGKKAELVADDGSIDFVSDHNNNVNAQYHQQDQQNLDYNNQRSQQMMHATHGVFGNANTKSRGKNRKETSAQKKENEIAEILNVSQPLQGSVSPLRRPSAKQSSAAHQQQPEQANNIDFNAQREEDNLVIDAGQSDYGSAKSSGRHVPIHNTRQHAAHDQWSDLSSQMLSEDNIVNPLEAQNNTQAHSVFIDEPVAKTNANPFKKQQTKKMYLYEGGQPESDDSEDPDQEESEEEEEEEQKVVAVKQKKPVFIPVVKENLFDQSERKQRAEKHVNIEIQTMQTAKKNYPRSKTLFYGLRFDWKSQNFTMHICLFLIRRIIMASFICFGGKYAYWGIQIMIATCILMLWLLMSYEQWRYKIITVQHIVNELILYALLWMLLMFQGAFQRIDDETYEVLGYIMLGILGFFILFNLIIIIWDGIIMQCVRHCNRRQNIIEFRKNRHSISDLNKRSLYAAKKLAEFHSKSKSSSKTTTTKQTRKNKKLKVKSLNGKTDDESKVNVTNTVDVNVVVENVNIPIQKQLETIPEEAAPMIDEAPLTMEIPTERQENLRDHSSKFSIVNTSVKSTTVQNKAPSIMTVTDTPQYSAGYDDASTNVQKQSWVNQIVQQKQQNERVQDHGANFADLGRDNYQVSQQIQQQDNVYVQPTEQIVPSAIMNLKSKTTDQEAIMRVRNMRKMEQSKTQENFNSQNPDSLETIITTTQQYNPMSMTTMNMTKTMVEPNLITNLSPRPESANVAAQNVDLLDNKIADEEYVQHSINLVQSAMNKVSTAPAQLDFKTRGTGSINLRRASFKPIGMNMDKMPSIQEVDDSSHQTNSRMGTAQQRSEDFSMIQIDSDKDLEAKREQQLPGFKKQSTISGMMKDIWGDKKPPLQTQTMSGLEKPLYNSEFIKSIESPSGIDKKIEINLNTNLISTSNASQGNSIQIDPSTEIEIIRTSTVAQPQSSGIQIIQTQPSSGIEITQSSFATQPLTQIEIVKTNDSLPQPKLQKKDTITRMLEDVDESMRSRAGRITMKVKEHQKADEEQKTLQAQQTAEVDKNAQESSYQKFLQQQEDKLNALEAKDRPVMSPKTKKSRELGSSRKLSTRVDHFDHNQAKPVDWIKSIWQDQK